MFSQELFPLLAKSRPLSNITILVTSVSSASATWKNLGPGCLQGGTRRVALVLG